jgi:hypothetical protein
MITKLFILICLISFSYSTQFTPQQNISKQQKLIPTQQPLVNVLFLPLDERFTTRDAFLNLAKLTPFSISTPATQYISYWRQPADLEYIYSWVDENLHNVSFVPLLSLPYSSSPLSSSPVLLSRMWEQWERLGRGRESMRGEER